ncbi:MAG: adenylate/guanylate cyclase domain-containing protein, partial [Rhodospirillales bacterium]|nr:adenylate/guanylate cyclase domain-containing protein [Rhodospirillales bacterium]
MIGNATAVTLPPSKARFQNGNLERRLAAILAADMVGYSRLVGNDEQGTVARLQTLRDALFMPQIGKFGGRLVKTMGDGLLVEFPSVVDAVECAVAVQESLAESDVDAPEERRIQFRIGINLGDILIDADDILGDGVNVAARLEGLAEPGGICVSGKVFEEVHNKLKIKFEDLGNQEVKNIAEPVHVYRICLGTRLSASAATQSPSKEDIFARLAGTKLPITNESGDLASAYSASGPAKHIFAGKPAASDAVPYTENSHLSQQALSHRDILSAGRLQVIGLGKIREHLGPGWDRVAERVHAAAENIIQKRLTATDMYYRNEEFGYLILFSELTKPEAKIKCALIAEEIVQVLLGDDEVGKTPVIRTIATSFKGA